MVNKKRKSRFRATLRWIGWVLLVQFVLINISASMYAYKLTHLYTPGKEPIQVSAKENILEKTWRLFAGPRVYKTDWMETPAKAYTTVRLQAGKNILLEAWYIKSDSTAKGTVILFHGLTGNKGLVLQQSNEFSYWGYNVLLVDARGHGNSTGQYTTIGYKESADVKAAYEYVQGLGEKNILLWGGSMGAVEILKAIADFDLKPAGIMLEMPFGSLQSFLKRRARTLGFPSQPFSFFTTCWISAEQGINGFKFNNIDYARKVNCPVLLQCGDKDHLVPLADNIAMYDAIPAMNKKLVVYTNTDHEILLQKDQEKWRTAVAAFLESITNTKDR